MAWTVAIAIPESDFMEEINANTRKTIFLSLVALGIAIFIGILTSHWVIKPILRLNNAAKKIASGKLNTQVQITRQDELGELQLSFNHMAAQLKESFQYLEYKIKERTAKLEIAK